MQRDPQEILELFLDLESAYSERNQVIGEYEDFFQGDHWTKEEDQEDETSFQLVLNYCRAIVLKYAALLSRSPRFNINVVDDDTQLKLSARKREALIRSFWKELQRVWRDAEMDASKKGYGVVQVMWRPKAGDPKSFKTLDGQNEQRYTQSPFSFQYVSPEYFYPQYRTYQKADDFLYVIRYDPGRFIADVQDRYGVDIKLEATTGIGLNDDDTFTIEDTVDLLEYWDDTDYYLIARTCYYLGGKKGGVTEAYYPVLLKQDKHTYGRCPFWVLQNIRNPGKNPTFTGSISDVQAISRLNQHLNQIFSETATEVVINVHRPVAYKSEDHLQDASAIELVPGAVIPIGAEEELEPVAWPGMPQSVDSHLDRTLAAIQDLSFVGQAGFGQYPGGATGVGLQIILQSMENILQLKIPGRIDILQDICEFMFRFVEKKLKPLADDAKPTPLQLWVAHGNQGFGKMMVTYADIDGSYFVDIDYGNLLPRNEVEFQQNEVYKYKTGVSALRTALVNIGVQDPDSEIATIMAELNNPMLHPEHVKMQLEIEMLKLQLQQTKQMQQQPQQPQQQQPPGAVPKPAMAAAPPSNTAPPVPGLPATAGGPAPMGAGTPFMGRSTGPNIGQMMAPGQKPGINRGPGMKPGVMNDGEG